MKVLFPKIPSKSSEKWVDALVDILNTVENKLGRKLVCQLLFDIAKHSGENENENEASWLKLVAPVLMDLNCAYIGKPSAEMATKRLRVEFFPPFLPFPRFLTGKTTHKTKHRRTTI